MIQVIRSILSLKNIPLLVLISIGIVSLTPAFAVLQVSADQVVIALVTLLAIEFILERVTTFRDIEQRVKALTRLVAAGVSQGSLIKRRDTQETFLLSIEGATEVWISAKTFKAVWTNYSQKIAEAVRNGTHFRILIHDPGTTSALQSLVASSSMNKNIGTVRRDIEAVRSAIQSLAAVPIAGSIELRGALWQMYNGYTFTNPRSLQARVYVELWGFQLSLAERMSTTILRETDGELFSYYLDQFERQFSAARILAEIGKK